MEFLETLLNDEVQQPGRLVRLRTLQSRKAAASV
jgi:hypothetical protein